MAAAHKAQPLAQMGVNAQSALLLSHYLALFLVHYLDSSDLQLYCTPRG